MKKFIKEILLWIGAVVYHDPAAKVVFYHDIGTKYTPMGTPPGVFKKHLEVVVRRSRVEGIGDLICFDDGFRGIFEHREVFKEVEGGRLKIKVFVAPGLVGQKGYLTWDEIRTLNREYGIDFQSHTWSHQTLVGPMIDESPKEERDELWYHRELVGSRQKIEEELNRGEGRGKRDVDELCFPVGYFSDELIERCQKAGYKKVYASFPGNIVGRGEGVVVQPRCLVQDLDAAAFKLVLKGGMNIFKNRYLKMHQRTSAREL